MILYHGTNTQFETVSLSASQRGKDFGRGFYLSDNESQAYDIAGFKALQLGGSAIVHRFEFDEIHLKDGSLKFLQFEDYSEEWAGFILENRRNLGEQNIHDYDVVFGPIANDKVGVQIRNYMEGNIDFDTFLNRLKYMKGITFQYCFNTPCATAFLQKI